MKDFAAELKVTIASRWSRSTAIVLIAACAFSFWSLYGQMGSMDQAVESMREAGGLTNDAELAAWVSASPDTVDLRQGAAMSAPGMGVNHGLALLGSLGPLLAIIWGASLVGSEYGFRTIRSRAAHSGWSTAITSKAAIAAFAGAVAVVAAGGIGAALQPALTRSVAAAFPWVMAVRAPQAPAVLPQALAVFLGLFVFALLGAVLATILRATAPAVVAGLFLMLFVQSPLGWWWLPENAYGDLLSRVITYPAGGLIGGTPAIPTDPPALSSYPVLVLVAWTVLLLGVLLAVAKRQEIP